MADLTEYETNRIIKVDMSQVDVYRGGIYFTTLYMKDDSVVYVKEDFHYVDRLFDKEVGNG